MRYHFLFLIVFCLSGATHSAVAAEPATSSKKAELPPPKTEIKKEPRSLMGVDPYDVYGSGVDPFDVNGKEPLDPYDVNNGRYLDPNDVAPPSEKPVEKQKEPWQPPKIFKDLENSIQTWKEKPAEPKPDVTLAALGSEIGAGYVGAFGGSVAGLFGGFIVGSIYGELANCSRCWLDVAVGGSVLGSAILTSTGVYMFGNTDEQLGSLPATVIASLVPVALAEGLYRNSKRVRKNTFYLISMPLFATLGYNMSRHFPKPGEKPLFKNIFVDDTWVSADPVNGIVALNLSAHF